MDEPQVILGLLFPAYEQASSAVGPRVATFDDPAAGALSAATRPGFGSTLGNVRHLAVPANQLLDRLATVAFVQAEMLPASSSRPGARYGNRTQRGSQKSLIVCVGPVDRDAQRHAARVAEHRALDAQLTAIGRVFPGFSPHPVAIWSSHRPSSANAKRSHVAGRRPSGRPSKTSGRYRVGPSLESSDAPCSAHRTGAVRLSTGNRYAVGKECRLPRNR